MHLFYGPIAADPAPLARTQKPDLPLTLKNHAPTPRWKSAWKFWKLRRCAICRTA